MCIMKNELEFNRRKFIGLTAITLAFSQFGNFGVSRAASTLHGKPANGVISSANYFKEIKQIHAGLLNIGYAEVGPKDGQVVLLVHGWPYSIHSFYEVANILAGKGFRVIVPHLRGHGTTTFLSANSARNGQQSAIARDMIDLMDALNIKKAIVGGFDWGARTVNIMAALWPDRCMAMVSVSGYLIGSQQANQTPLPPKAELSWWYQYYFATERGLMGYSANRKEFARLIWETASPKWQFDNDTFDESAKVFENEDHVAIVIDNYRWRLGITKGEKKYDEYEKILATAPAITIPTITLEGDANGAPHPDPKVYAAKFTGKYSHYNLSGGIGHNPPQESPERFAEAIMEASSMSKKD